MGEKQICEVLDYERDIKPYKFIKIFAGVGSGKTNFICKMIMGDEEYNIPKQTVLLVTSRRSTVEEGIRRMGADVQASAQAYGNLTQAVYESGDERPYEYEEYVRILNQEEVGDELVLHNQSVVCTNAHIEQYMRKNYIPDDPATHLWELFDTIVIDEVHSLITDATYQTAPFYVHELINEYLRRASASECKGTLTKHLIIMTGTPAPLSQLTLETFPADKTACYELFDSCKRVLPQNICVIDQITAIRKLKYLLKNGEKIVCFSNAAITERQVHSKWNVSNDIKVAVSFSSDTTQKIAGREANEEMHSVAQQLAETNMLPADIQLFVTTSKNKEGINIMNDDFQTMFIESHFTDEIIQMSGRLRSGAKDVYIISDKKQHPSTPNTVAVDFTTTYIVPREEEYNEQRLGDANTHFRALCEKEKLPALYANGEYTKSVFKHDNEAINRYISYIHSVFPFVRYSYLKNRFVFYSLKEKAEAYIDEKTSIFKKALVNISADLYVILHDCFPGATISVSLAPQQQVIAYLEENVFIYRKANKKKLKPVQYESLLADLGEILGKKVVYPNSVLNELNFSVKRKAQTGDYYIFRLKARSSNRS